MPSRHMRICICAGPFQPSVGGIEEISRILAVAFAKRGNSVEVLTYTLASGDRDHALPYAITRTTSALARWRAFRRCDLALFMNVSLNALPLALFAGCRIVLSHHGIYRFVRGSAVAQLLEFVKRQLTRFFPNISVSHFVAGALPGKSTIVPNAYDNVLFRALPQPRGRDFVFCGRLVSDKGVEMLIRAFAEALVAHPGATLSIIGDGPEKHHLEALAHQLQSNHSIDFRGTLRGLALAEALREHRCMVVPSLWEEPFGIVALEGIACCDLVIATRRGGLPEAVGPCGLIVDPTVQSLGDAMKLVLLACDKGDALPGTPSVEMRERHLLRHSPDAIADGYLATCHSATQ